jgi:hypothetical protein
MTSPRQWARSVFGYVDGVSVVSEGDISFCVFRLVREREMTSIFSLPSSVFLVLVVL